MKQAPERTSKQAQNGHRRDTNKKEEEEEGSTSLNFGAKGNGTSEGFKESMALYQDLFVAKVGAKPDIDGRDGKILSGLLKSHGAEEVKGLLTFFFKTPPDWVEAKGKFPLYTFKGIYTELLVRWKKQDTGMREF